MTPNVKRHLAAASEKLGHLLMWGIPILEALEVTAEECSDKTVAKAVRQMRTRAANGQGLLSETGNLFPKSVQLLLSAGERTGQLPKSCLIIAQVLRAESGK